MTSKTVSITSADKGLSMEFYPEIGGSVGRFDLHKDGRCIPVFRTYDKTAPLHEFNMANFPMVPMCGRTDHGKFHFNGEIFHVGPPSEGEPHPNHGNGRTLPWQVTQLEDNFITMELTAR